jgi:hypothetical protein
LFIGSYFSGQWTAHRQESHNREEQRHNRQEQRQKLDLELKTRLQQWTQYASRPESQTLYHTDVMKYTEVLLAPVGEERNAMTIYGAYSDLADRQFASLLVERAALAETSAEKTRIEFAARNLAASRIMGSPLPLGEFTLQMRCRQYVGQMGLSEWFIEPPPTGVKIIR